MWFSENPDEYQWIQIDMMNHPIQLNGYSIQSNDGGGNNEHLKSWVIEGSNDQESNKKWEEIDRRINNNDLNGRYKVNYFQILKKSKSFQYIRLRMIDKNHGNTHFLGLIKFELFGDLNESN